MPAVFLIIAATVLYGNPTERFEYSEPHMGTKVRIVLYAPDRATADAAAKAAFARIADLESALSDYRADSEIMKLCRANDTEPGKARAIGSDLARVLEVAIDVSKRSDGAFDVTIGPLSQLWRETRKTRKLPDKAILNESRKLVGWKFMTLDRAGKTLAMTKAGMRLDFGGIGKGFAADEALIALKKKNISSALVALSGDIAVSAAPPDRGAWLVDVQPLDPQDPPRQLKLVNAAVSTSGDLFQHVEIEGIRYSHVLDPKAGLGLTGFRSVTVIAPHGILSDSLSKAASLLSPKPAVKLIEEFEGAILIASKDKPDGKITTLKSKSFDSYLAK